MSTFLDNKKFDVEHALGMYATSFVTMPASGIYEDDVINLLLDQIARFHIYLMSFTPNIDFAGAKEDGRDLVTTFDI